MLPQQVMRPELAACKAQELPMWFSSNEATFEVFAAHVLRRAQEDKPYHRGVAATRSILTFCVCVEILWFWCTESAEVLVLVP